MTALVAATRAALRSAGSRRARRSRDRARHDRLDGDSGRRCASSRSTTTISGATTARKDEAALITDVAQRTKLPAIEYCGGVYSSEWGFAKLLHWLRHNPDKRARFATALEHCDMVAATSAWHHRPAGSRAIICAMGHKWLWNDSLGGFPPEEFFLAVDPLLAGIREKLGARDRYRMSDQLAGHLDAAWAERLGLHARHSDSRRRVRRALGCDRRRHRRRRRRQCRRHRDVHHGDREERRVRSRGVRRRGRFDSSGVRRHRSGTFGDAVSSSRRSPRAHRRRSTICHARSRDIAPAKRGCCD